jgi:DNA primase catalytic subunit
MSSVITQANFGGEAAVGLVSGPVCFAGRSLHAHVQDPDIISLGNRHQAHILHVLPMQMLGPRTDGAAARLAV